MFILLNMSKHWIWFYWCCLVLTMIQGLHENSVEQRVFLRAQCKAKCLNDFINMDDNLATSILNQLGLKPDAEMGCFKTNQEKCRDACFSSCDSHPNECHSKCPIGRSNSIGCQLGCLHLLDSSKDRPGSCPISNNILIPKNKNHFSTQNSKISNSFHSETCLKECTDDNSCPNPLHKCCPSGCKDVCSMPHYMEAIPSLPPPLQLKPVQTNTGVMELSWSSNYINFTNAYGPIVFVLQTRFCPCKIFSLDHVSPWQTLIMASNLGATLNAFDPGQMYEFRVAAVGVLGSRGFGVSSKPYPKEPKRPQPPEPPQNVTAVKWRIHSNGHISIRLNWVAPEHSDLPISKYLITWVLDYGYLTSNNPPTAPVIPFAESLSPDTFEFTLPNLLPQSSFKVQIIAMSYWYGYGKLESQPNTIFLSTQSLNPKLHQGFEFEKDHGIVKNNSNKKKSCKCAEMTKNDDRLEIRAPEIYQSDLTAIVLLKSFSHNKAYQIEWYPQVCIDSRDNTNSMSNEILTATVRSQLFRLTKLKFNCVYVVRLTPLDENNQKQSLSKQLKTGMIRKQIDEWPFSTDSEIIRHKYVDVVAACFCTSTCRETNTVWPTKPHNCPEIEPDPPLPPMNIQVELLDFVRMDYQVSWTPPLSEETSGKDLHDSPRQYFSRYRIMWAPRMKEPVDTTMYNDAAGFSPIPDLQYSDVRVVKKNQTRIVLPNLRPNTFYIVRIQTLTPNIEGREQESLCTVHYFVTHNQLPFVNTAALKSSYAKSMSTSKSVNLLCTFILLCFVCARGN